MSNEASPLRIWILAAMTAALMACSSGNSDAPATVDRSGNHPAGWVLTHWDAYNSTKTAGKVVGKSVGLTVSPCAECHGGDLLSPRGTGGIARVGCFVPSRDGQMCHANSDGKLGHPTGWGAAPGSLHGRGAMAAPGASSGFAYCAQCHGGAFPASKITSCMVSACHGNATSPHPAKPWHGTTASGTNHVLTDPANASECAKCHAGNVHNTGRGPGAAPLPGAAPGCFNNTLCHDYGHAAFAPGAFRAAAAHGPPAKSSLDLCQSCHATPIAGQNPRFNVARAGIANGCETCHLPLTAHPTPWLPGRVGMPFNVANATSHATAGNLTLACGRCHGTGLDGVAGVAPSCMSSSIGSIGCHVTKRPDQFPIGCVSCHEASTSGPTGNVWPNRGYAHNRHAQGLGLTCSVCHGSSTSGAASHANLTTDMIFSTTFRANPGIAVSYDRNSRTCAGVSCHGGQTTPDWRQPNAINTATDCFKCHEAGTGAGTPQYNSYHSGKHAYHLTGGGNAIYRALNGVPIACSDCHNTTTLATNHFAGLDTPAMDPAIATIGGGSTRITSYNPSKTCSTSCHLVGGEGSW